MMVGFEYNNRVYVRGHKYVLGPTLTHFKMSLRRAQNIFMPKNINSITIIITSEGIEKIKTEKKMTTKPVSYTHLRAHETRSNLVCRLLLEKKK